MNKIDKLRFEATDACSCHRAALTTVDGASVRVTVSGDDFCITAINDDGAMVAHPRIPDGLLIVSRQDLERLID